MASAYFIVFQCLMIFDVLTFIIYIIIPSAKITYIQHTSITIGYLLATLNA